jgi:uncharacterized protein YerC
VTQVSRHNLLPEIYSELYDNFDYLIASLNSKEEIFECFKILLTRNEKIMIAKRVAILLLFARGYNIREIARFIKVSTSTVMRYYKYFTIGSPGFHIIVEKMSETQSAGKLFDSIKSFFNFTADMLSVKTDMRARARVARGGDTFRKNRYRMRPG